MLSFFESVLYQPISRKRSVMVVISALGSTVNSSCELPVRFGTVIDVIPVIAAMII